MKTIKLLIFTLCLLLCISVKAQNRNNENEKLKSLKIGFITQKLELTSKEAQGFWPIYNKHQEKIHSHRESLKESRRNIRLNGGFKDISDKNAEELLDKFMEFESKIHQEEMQMYQELKSVLPSKKILILHKTESDFNRKILEQLKKRRAIRQNKN